VPLSDITEELSDIDLYHKKQIMSISSTAYDNQHIVILDASGNPVGSKPRKLINRRKDILHVTYIFVMTGDNKLVLQKIPQQHPKKLYGGTWGISVAALVGLNEDPADVAVNALARELYIQHADVESLGEHFGSIEKNILRRQSVYMHHTSKQTVTYNPKKMDALTYVTREELEQQLQQHPLDFASTFILLWKRYQDQLILKL
jgi:isopentenyldiphosphate isomerase